MSNDQFNLIMQAISELAGDVKQVKQKLDEHTKILDEHTKILNELQDSFELLGKDNWQNKKDILRLKKTIGIE